LEHKPLIMNSAIFEQAAKMAELANKVNKLANAGSMATKGILLNERILKWASEGTKVHSLINKGLNGSMATQIKMYNLYKSAPTYIKHAIKPTIIHEGYRIISADELKFESHLTVLKTENFKFFNNNISQLETFLSTREIELQRKKKNEAELKQLLENTNFCDVSNDLHHIGEPRDIFGMTGLDLHSWGGEFIDASDFGLRFIQKQADETRQAFADYESFKKLIALLDLQDEIKQYEKEIIQIRSAINWFSSLFKRFQINRRERFRRINSFLFKNLDDYHSQTLLSVGY